jgi:hypothetical protein
MGQRCPDFLSLAEGGKAATVDARFQGFLLLLGFIRLHCSCWPPGALMAGMLMSLGISFQ